MRKTVFSISFLFYAAVMITPSYFIKPKTKPVIIGYVGGFRGLIATDSIDVWRLSHINYAFVDIKDNRAWLHNEATDTVNLRKLSELKKINPDLKNIDLDRWMEHGVKIFLMQHLLILLQETLL